MSFSIITIEREFGSGGQMIGEQVAERLGIPCYGRRILELAAERYNTTVSHLINLEESATNSLLYSLHAFSKLSSGERVGISDNDLLTLAEREIIQDIALKGPCVIIGRCAGCFLAERNDVLKVFIHADREIRIERAVSEYEVLPKMAETMVKKYDRRRSGYYAANSDRKWKDAMGYDLMLNSGTLDISTCADAIVSVYKHV